jgi:hypothetical protein
MVPLYYDPRENGQSTFVNTVSENKQGFTMRQIKGAENARTLYVTLSYPSMKDFKWVIRSNQIKDCPVPVQDVDVALKIWGKNIAALKGKTTRHKPNLVARDYVKISTELLNLHKEDFLTTDIIFVNLLANRSVPEIFKAFKEIYRSRDSPRSASARGARTGCTTRTDTRAPQIHASQVPAKAGVHSEHDRLEVFLRRNTTG